VPNYSAEHTLTTFHTVREHMAGRLLGQGVRSAADLLRRLEFVKGNQFDRAAFDIAWWVLDARRRGVPLHVALGGKADHVATPGVPLPEGGPPAPQDRRKQATQRDRGYW